MSRAFRLPDPFFPQTALREGAWLNTVGAVAAAVWPSASLGIIQPVTFPVNCTLYAMYALGNNTTGNYDLALYDAAMGRLASKGSTALAAATLTLSFSSPISVLAGVTYYAGMACDSASSSVFRSTSNDSNVRQLISVGMGQQASAIPLPNPFVPAILAVDYVPLIGFGVR